jgi:hypothetical protein
VLSSEDASVTDTSAGGTPAEPVQGATAREAADSPAGGAPAEPAQDATAREAARRMFGGTQAPVGVVAATFIGTALGALVVQHYSVTLVVLGAYGLVGVVLYYWGAIRRLMGVLRRAPTPTAPSVPERAVATRRESAARESGAAAQSPHSDAGSAAAALRRGLAWRVRGGTAVLIVILAACCSALGYWVIGNGFAHSLRWGALSLLLTVIIVSAAILGARWWQRSWPSWLRYRARTAMACSVAAAGLSAGVTLGSTNLVPPCSPPAELTVLTSQQTLGAVQAAIPEFERTEPARLHTACYAVDVEAYAAATDYDAWHGLETGWGAATLSASGPRPEIWIPDSSAEVTAVRDHNGPRLTALGSIASSPLVVAIPSGLVTGPLARLLRQGKRTTWRSIYTALSHSHIGLAMPDPAVSETARLEIAGLYAALTPAEERGIESSGSFPADSGSLLCAAAQADEHDDRPVPTAYLVSEAAMIASNTEQLAAGPCAALTQLPLTAFRPASAAALDFPFTTVKWGGSASLSTRLSRYEIDFYNWLTGPARSNLTGSGLGPPRCGRTSQARTGADIPGCGTANLPTAAEVTQALDSFRIAQAPAHIVIAIDDSGPMQPYLPRITAAVDAELGPGAAHVGSRDSFGIWKLPGDGGQIDQKVTGFGPAAATESRVPSDVGVLSGHDHSADYAVLARAGELLYGQPTASLEPTNAVILLTDGDGYPQGDPHGSSQLSVTGLFDKRPPGRSAIKLYVIAFGPEGCAESETTSSQSLSNFAEAAGGSCLSANGANPQQLLAQVLSQISTGK